MKKVLKLAAVFLIEHPVRIVLTLLAVIAAACMVVWVVSGYDALLDSFDDFSNQSLGRYTLSVAPISTFQQVAPGAIPSHARKFVPPEAVDALRNDPAVAAADSMWARRVRVRPVNPSQQPVMPSRGRGKRGHKNDDPAPPDGASASRRIPEVRMLGTMAPASPFPMLRGRWIDPGHPNLPEAAISIDSAQHLGVDIGDEIIVGRDKRSRRLRIVGIVNVPALKHFRGRVATGQLLTPSVGGLYVPMPLAEQIAGYPARISFVGVSLKPDTDITQFRFGWAPKLSRFSTPVQFQEAHDIEEALDQSATADHVSMQAWTATGISLLAALFIIFSTLNMGVSERIRQFAILRAVSFTRLQVSFLIGIESMMLATIGLIGGVGAGWFILRLASRSSPELLGAGAIVGRHSILLAAACAYGGALLAAIVPAYRATHVRPLDAMAPRSSHRTRHVSRPAVWAGLLLIAVNPLLTFFLPMGDRIRIVLYILVGCPCMAAGFIMLAPAVVLMVDRLISPGTAYLLGLKPALLASQLTSNLWRTVGTAMALTIGLGLFVAIQVWGYTMLDAFVPGPWAPDALITFKPNGLPPKQAATVAEFDGVDPEHCLPIVVEQPRLLEDLTHSAKRATVTRQDNVVIVGIDPTRAFRGPHPLLEMEWVEGSPNDAIPLLEQGRACIVPGHFLHETGLRVGDAFALVPPENHEQPVYYTIAGAVRLPGWHWQTKPTGFRSRTHRAAALVFADYTAVARDFDLRNATHVWLDFDETQTDSERLAAQAQALYSALQGCKATIGPNRDNQPYIRVMPVEWIRCIVRSHAKQWIWAMSRLPLIMLLITCVGVLNAMLASVRARRWDLGVLRAIGLTRWTLVRMVVAEGLLVGMTACILSTCFGIIAGWCGTGISQYTSFFGGLHPALIIPWQPVSGGLLAVLLLSALASVWPAVSIGRAEPLTLLQQGRGAF
jgi:putative ABC transport system permease protein